MSDTERLLQQAANEIEHMRRELSLLRAQAFVVETFHAALLGPPIRGESPDLVWAIRRHLQSQENVDVG